MDSVDSQAVEKPSVPVSGGRDACLRQLWKTVLLVQGHVDSSGGAAGDEEGRALAVRLFRLCRELLEGDNLKFAQGLLVRCASLKTRKKEQHLFPARILDKCFFKSRTGTFRSHQNYSEDAASYAGEQDSKGGAKQFAEDFSAHLKCLEEAFAGAAGEENSQAVHELALCALAHVVSVFQEDVRRLFRESKPFEIAARAVLRAFEGALECGASSASAGLGEGLPCRSVLQAYCGSVLNRLESIERLGPAKSAKIFNKYLTSLGQANSELSLETILGRHSPNSFPELHHLPVGEFAALTADSASGREGEIFLGLLSRISLETILRARELLRLNTFSILHSNKVFQVKEGENDMAPVKHQVATRLLLAAYRQVRTHLNELGILGQRGRHYFGWYSVPRVFEAFFIGRCRALSVTGILPPGADRDPWSEDLADLRMEYCLAKIERRFYEPPLYSAAASAFVFLSWEIASLGVTREAIQVDAVDEAAGTLALSFDYTPADSEEKPIRCSLAYTMGDIERAQCKNLALPDKTDPVMFDVSEELALPSALLFVGEGIVKELPRYQRFNYGKNLILYVQAAKIAPKVRKERPKPGKKPDEKLAAKKAAPGSSPVKPEQTEIAKMAAALLEADRTLKVLRQETLAWTREVLERIAADRKVAGKQRRNFRRLHHQLRHQKGRGFSNRLEGEFIAGLANLSKQFDTESES